MSLAGGEFTELDSVSGSTAYLDRLGLGPQRLGGYSGFSPPRDNVDARHSISGVARGGFFWTGSTYTSTLSRLVVAQPPIGVTRARPVAPIDFDLRG